MGHLMAARKRIPRTAGQANPAVRRDAGGTPADVVRRARVGLQEITDGCEELMAEGAALAREADRAIDFGKRVQTFFRRVSDAATKKGGT